MGAVLVVILIVIAGGLYMARNANRGTPRASSGLSDGYVPVNAYDNPYDTNENNDRPFEPDSCSDSADDSSSSDTCDSSDSSSAD